MKQDEFTPLPPEFRSGKSEFSPLPPEFPERAPRFPGEPRRKRLFMLAAAALVLAMLILPRRQTPEEMPALTQTPAAAVPTTEPDLPPQEPAPVYTEPAITEPAVTEPAAPPECMPIFFAFSDSLRAKLIFTGTEAIRSVRAELWDAAGDTPEQTWEVPAEAIAQGEYTLPDMMGVFDMYMAHHDDYNPTDPFPVPELRVFLTVQAEGGEAAVTYTQSVSEEHGWGVRVRDGELRFQSYESYEPLSILVGASDWQQQLDQLRAGEFLLMIQLNGTQVSEADCTITADEDTWQTADGEDITFHYVSLTVPQQGSTGNASVTVFQKLAGYDLIWTETVELNY